MKTSKQLAADMRKSLDKRAQKNRFTFGLYSLETAAPVGKDMWYAPPFLAVDDETALNALVEMSKSHPEICHRNVYRVGTFCAVDGKVVSCRPQVVVKQEVSNV